MKKRIIREDGSTDTEKKQIHAEWCNEKDGEIANVIAMAEDLVQTGEAQDNKQLLRTIDAMNKALYEGAESVGDNTFNLVRKGLKGAGVQKPEVKLYHNASFEFISNKTNAQGAVTIQLNSIPETNKKVLFKGSENIPVGFFKKGWRYLARYDSSYQDPISKEVTGAYHVSIVLTGLAPDEILKYNQATNVISTLNDTQKIDLDEMLKYKGGNIYANDETQLITGAKNINSSIDGKEAYDRSIVKLKSGKLYTADNHSISREEVDMIPDEFLGWGYNWWDVRTSRAFNKYVAARDYPIMVSLHFKARTRFRIQAIVKRYGEDTVALMTTKADDYATISFLVPSHSEYKVTLQTGYSYVELKWMECKY